MLAMLSLAPPARGSRLYSCCCGRHPGTRSALVRGGRSSRSSHGAASRSFVGKHVQSAPQRQPRRINSWKGLTAVAGPGPATASPTIGVRWSSNHSTVLFAETETRWWPQRRRIFPSNSTTTTRQIRYLSSLPSTSLEEDSQDEALSQAIEPASAATVPAVRLSKWISQNSGISRREVERLMKSGDVTLAGQVMRAPAVTMSYAELLKASSSLKILNKVVRVAVLPVMPRSASANSATADDGVHSNKHSNLIAVGPTQVRVWLVHKLKGELVTEADPQLNRPTVLQRMLRSGVGKTTSTSSKSTSTTEHLKPIGRLDMNTEGLLLLTNCGTYARDMELPLHALHRTYRVRVHGKLLPYKLEAIRRGGVRVTVPERQNEVATPVTTKVRSKTSSFNQRDAASTTVATLSTAKTVRYGPMQVVVEDTRKRSAATNQWLQITCTEGKNRQIRNVLAQFRLTVTRLIRISYGDYQLQTIPPGMVIEVPVKAIADQKRKGSLVKRGKKSPSRRADSSSTRSISPRSMSPSRTAKAASAVQWVRTKRVAASKY